MQAIRWKHWLKLSPLVLVGLLVLMQAVPYGRAHTNPPVVTEPVWDSATTRELAVRTCCSCHSNETTWPWYSNFAPFSWLVQSDVDGGRAELNFSEWSSNRPLRNATQTVGEGEMPPWFYLPLHPEARLSAAETEELAAGLAAMAAGR